VVHGEVNGNLGSVALVKELHGKGMSLRAPFFKRYRRPRGAIDRVRLLPVRGCLCVPNVWPAPDLQVDFCDLVSISLH